MVSLEQAQDILKNCVSFLTETEMLPLQNAVGRVLASDAAAVVDQPPFPRSPLDGYALRGNETEDLSREHPGVFRVIGKVCAGEVFDGTVGEGEAVRIMTGAPIPEGADTVIRQEWTDYGTEQVKVYGKSKPYQDYCYQGEDYKKGEVLLQKGTVLDGISIAILASLGMERAEVYRLPKVAVISTGDEVIQPGQPLKPGKIYDSNLHFICARLREMGLEPFYAGHSEDLAQSMADRIREVSREADLVITTGGVSVGEKDIMHEVVTLLDARQLFWRVDLKPGAPTLAMEYREKPVICLSGNPFGAAVNFELLVRCVIEKMTADPKWQLKKSKKVLQSDFCKRGGVRRFLRAHAKGHSVFLPEGSHASGVLSSMFGCNCLVEIPEEADGMKKGETVWVYRLD